MWRIGVDTRDYTADDRSGTGAKRTGGRWNREGQPVLYCAQSPSLAGLETLVHLGTADLPLNRYLVAIDIPDDVWAARYAPNPLPVGWDAIPVGMVSLDVGDAWLSGRTSAVMVVPSVVVPEDLVVLINPEHPDTARIEFEKVRRWLYDPRLRGAVK